MSSARSLIDSLLLRPSSAGFMIAIILVYLIVSVYQNPTPSNFYGSNSSEVQFNEGNISFAHPVVTIRPNVVKWGVDFGFWQYSLNTSALTATNYPIDLTQPGPILVDRKAPQIVDSLDETLQGVLSKVFEKNATKISPQAFVRAVILDTYWERLAALLGKTPYASKIRFGVSFYNKTPVEYTFTPYGNETSYILQVPRWELTLLTPLTNKQFPPYVYLNAQFSLSKEYTGSLQLGGGGSEQTAIIGYTYVYNGSTGTFWTDAYYDEYTQYLAPKGNAVYNLKLTIYRYWGYTPSEAIIVKNNGKPITTISPATKEKYIITIPLVTIGDSKINQQFSFSNSIEVIVYDKEHFAGFDKNFKYTEYDVKRNPFTAKINVGGRVQWRKEFLYVHYQPREVSTTTTTVTGNSTLTLWGTGTVYDETHYYSIIPYVNLTKTETYNPIKNPHEFNEQVKQAYEYLNKYGARDLHALFGYAYLTALWDVIQKKVSTTPASAYTIMAQIISAMKITFANPAKSNDVYYIVADKAGNVTYFARIFYQYAFPVYQVSSDQFLVLLPEYGDTASHPDYVLQELLHEVPYIKVSFWGGTPKNCLSKYCTNLTYGADYYAFFEDYGSVYTNYTTYTNGTFTTTRGYILKNTGWGAYWRTIEYYGNNTSDYYWVPIATLPKAKETPQELPTGFHYKLPTKSGPVVKFYFDYNPVPYLGFQQTFPIVIEQYNGTPVFWQVVTLTNGTVLKITQAPPPR